MQGGGALNCFDYGIGFLPFIKRLKLEYPEISQPCYADNYGSLGTFDNLKRYFNSFKLNGPYQGCLP